MNNFTYHVYTDVRFGKDQINTLPELIAPIGKKVLLVYGGGSIKRNGIYDKIQELLSTVKFMNYPALSQIQRLSLSVRVRLFVRNMASK